VLTSARTSLLNVTSTSTLSPRSATDIAVIIACELRDPGSAASWDIAGVALRPANRNRRDAAESMCIAVRSAQVLRIDLWKAKKLCCSIQFTNSFDSELTQWRTGVSPVCTARELTPRYTRRIVYVTQVWPGRAIPPSAHYIS